MNGLHARIARSFRSTPLKAITLLALTLLIALPAAAQEGWGGVVTREEEVPTIRPYILGYMGFGEPMDAAYDQVFTKSYLRAGGGFGMRYRGIGAEVLLRRGSVEESMLITSDDAASPRNFLLRSTEVQLRLYGAPALSSLRFPTGLSIGLTTLTVDRGDAGPYDRFSATGFYAGPFAGVEYSFGKTFSFGVEVEYGLSEANFNNNEAWSSRHSSNLPLPVPSTENSFWDTVGGSRTTSFESGGLIVSARATIFIPSYRGGEE